MERSGAGFFVLKPEANTRRIQKGTIRDVASKTCTVRFVDQSDVTHSVTVTADSLFEAVARGLRCLRSGDWSAEAAWWAGYVEVSIRQPEVVQKILLKDFEAYLKRSGGSPREVAQRQYVRGILEK